MRQYNLEDFEGLPHPEVRLLLMQLEGDGNGNTPDWAVIRKLREAGITIPPGVLSPLSRLDEALSLIPKEWWWHISHLEAQVIPTTPAPGAEHVMSNAGAYDKRGRPIRYCGDCHYDRAAIPRAICEAMLKAAYNLPAAFHVQSKATEEDPPEVVKARQQRMATRHPMPG